MQPSGGGGGGGGGGSAAFFDVPTHPGIVVPTKKKVEEKGPGTVFEFVQGFTPIPNPVARTILSDTSLSPEQQQIHANLMGLRNGGSVGFRPLGYASGGLGDLGAISTADTPRRATAEEMKQAQHTEALRMLEYFLGEGRNEIPSKYWVTSENSLNKYFQIWRNNPDAAIADWNEINAGMKAMKEEARGAGPMAPTAPTDEDMSILDRIFGESRNPMLMREEIPPPRSFTALGRGLWNITGRNKGDPSGFMVGETADMRESQRDIRDLEEEKKRKYLEEEHWSGFPRRLLRNMTSPPVEQEYAHGGYASRGTVAGELGRRGDMSVREEGESMQELAKRHKEQDWYNRMRQSPTLGKVRIA
tara:strand:+ start:451 stop:1530 length:1080 start_codon:yes stop_codon:yes gene_type:complete